MINNHHERSIYNVNHKNMVVMWQYLKDYGKQHGLSIKDINVFDMLELPFPNTFANALEYYTDQTQWSSLDTYVSCYLKVKELTGDPDIFRKCGRTAGKNRRLYSWQQIASALGGPRGALNYIPHIIPDWNDTKIFEIIEPAQYNPLTHTITAIFKYKFHPHIDPCSDYCSDPHILGLFESIPHIFPASILKPWVPLPLGTIEQFMVQYDPIKLYSGRFFKHLNLRPFWDGNLLNIYDPNTNTPKTIGKKVILTRTELNGKSMYLGKHETLSDKSDAAQLTGTLITKTISYKGEPICLDGVIMEAPCFMFKFTCQAPRSARLAWKFHYTFSAKIPLLNELFKTNDRLKNEIEEKNRAYDDLKYYSDNLENIVQERTELLRQTSAYVRQLDQVVMRVVSHGLGNWSANAIADSNLIINSVKSGKVNDKTNEYLNRLVSNCGVAAMAAIGLNYYCRNDVVITIQDVVDYLLKRAHLSIIVDLDFDENIKFTTIDGRIFMILSEIFQNAVKAQINQGYNDRLNMNICLDKEQSVIIFTLTNTGKLLSNLHIPKDVSSDFPEKQQGGWICRRLTTDLGGTISWVEENEKVKTTISIPVKKATAEGINSNA